MSKADNINTFVIVGGGTAGWISAAILARALANTQATITVIESPNVPIIGVGEATIPSMVDLLQYLKIPLRDFIIQTNATFKLGIKFVDWHEQGQHYWHQFGHVGNKIDAKPFYQHWLKHHLTNPRFDYTDFSPSVALAKQHKFFIADPRKPSNLSASTYALHFDASLVAKYLMAYRQQQGVKLIKAHVNKTVLDQSGSIASVKLADATEVPADFFIDCSGQQALLINKALRVGYENWQHFLPVDRAMAVQSQVTSPLNPYTEATAHEHGWRWRIPLQNRVGNGYVYSSDYCSDDQALALLNNNVDNMLTDPRVLKFTTGKREKMWYKNCLAVGLSSGFLEPLESTSIYLIMRSMLNFVQSIPNKSMQQPTIDEFNRLMDNEYRNIRDFIVLHYCTSQRRDSAFWQMWQHAQIPQTLADKLALFKCQGRLYNNSYDLFSPDSWYAVLEGMKVRPTTYDPLVDASDFNKVEQAFIDTVDALTSNVNKTLSHEDYLAKLLNNS